MMRHAQQRCDKILIMSAKYGLLEMDSPVSYYDAYLPTLTEAERARLVEQLRCQIVPGWDCSSRVLSYLPKAYYEFLAEVKPALASKLHRPYRKLPMLTLYKILSNEVTHYGIHPARR